MGKKIVNKEAAREYHLQKVREATLHKYAEDAACDLWHFYKNTRGLDEIFRDLGMTDEDVQLMDDVNGNLQYLHKQLRLAITSRFPDPKED